MQFSMTASPSCMIAPDYFPHPVFAPKKVLDKNEACLSCRRRKTKCDGNRPSCGTCSRLEKNCIFPSKNSKDGIQNKARQISRKPSAYSKVMKSSSTKKDRTAPSIKSYTLDTLCSMGISNIGIENSAAQCERDSYSSGVLWGSDRPIGSSTIISGRSRRASSVSEKSHFSNSTSSSDSSSSTLFLESDREGLQNWFPYETCRGNGGIDNNDTWFHKLEDFNPRSLKPRISTSSTANPFLPAQLDRVYDNFPIDYSNIAQDDGSNSFNNNTCFGDTSTSAFSPQVDIINNLISIFFDQVHPVLFCINEKQFREDVSTIHTDSRRDPTALLYAILGLAAKKHPDSDIRSLAEYWNISARVIVQNTMKDERHSVMFVQALLWNAFWSFTAGDFTDAKDCIMNARAIAGSLGIPADTYSTHVKKAPSTIVSDNNLRDPSTRLDIHMALQGLARLEQAVSLGSDLWTNVDKNEDHDNFKVLLEDSASARAEDLLNLSDLSYLFLDSPIALPSASVNNSQDDLNQIISFIDTIRTFHRRRSASNHDIKSKEEFANLETLLTYYRLAFQTSYPSSLTTFSTKPMASCKNLESNHHCPLLIQVMLHVATILLYNAEITGTSSSAPNEIYNPNQYSLLSPPISERSKDSPSFDILNINTVKTLNIVSPTESSTCSAVADTLTNAAADGILSIIKSAADLRPESPLLNPLLAPGYCLLSKVLLKRLSAGEGNTERAKTDIIIIILILSRIGEQWGDVGIRYRDAVVTELQSAQKTH